MSAQLINKVALVTGKKKTRFYYEALYFIIYFLLKSYAKNRSHERNWQGYCASAWPKWSQGLHHRANAQVE